MPGEVCCFVKKPWIYRPCIWFMQCHFRESRAGHENSQAFKPHGEQHIEYPGYLGLTTTPTNLDLSCIGHRACWPYECFPPHCTFYPDTVIGEPCDRSIRIQKYYGLLWREDILGQENPLFIAIRELSSAVSNIILQGYARCTLEREHNDSL